MKHMKLDSDQKDQETAVAVKPPDYPWGLQIHLDHNALEKLGIKELPEVGTRMRLDAKVHVSSAAMNDGPMGKQKSISLQITHMGLAKGHSNYEETDGETKGKKLYGGEKEK